MKHFRLFAFFIALFPSLSNATDILVNEFGTGGAYSTISAAITAASAGDRILIQPKSGGAAYVENLTINKPLQLLSATDSTQWKMQGTVTMVNITSGSTFSLVGMNNVSGNFTAATGPASAPRAKLYMLGCSIGKGNVSVTGDYIQFTMANCNLDTGQLFAKFIRAFGNYISATTGLTNNSVVTVTSDAQDSEDTAYFVGNTVINTEPTSSVLITSSVVKWTNNTQYFCIMNNFVKGYSQLGSNGSTAAGIETGTVKTGLGTDCIINNTVYLTTGSASLGYGYSFAPSSQTAVQVYNNIAVGNIYNGFYKTNTTYAAAFSYNYSNAATLLVNITNDGTNGTITQASINASTGVSSVTNNGYPSSIFYDTNLTINDAGCYGGSFTQNNFLPRLTSAARVYFVDAPRSVVQGGQLKFKAEGYDR